METLLYRIENKNLTNVELGMCKHNGIEDVGTLNCVINAIHAKVVNDPIMSKCKGYVRVIKTEHGVNIYSRPVRARLLGFKCAENCDLASILAKRFGGMFPNYTTDATRKGAYTQHKQGMRGIKTVFKNLTMVSPALLIHQGFNGEYTKDKTKSKVNKIYGGLD